MIATRFSVGTDFLSSRSTVCHIVYWNVPFDMRKFPSHCSEVKDLQTTSSHHSRQRPNHFHWQGCRTLIITYIKRSHSFLFKNSLSLFSFISKLSMRSQRSRRAYSVVSSPYVPMGMSIVTLYHICHIIWHFLSLTLLCILKADSSGALTVYTATAILSEKGKWKCSSGLSL